jgi:hypothetical protein
MTNHDEGPKGIESRILGKVGILSFEENCFYLEIVILLILNPASKQ